MLVIACLLCCVIDEVHFDVKSISLLDGIAVIYWDVDYEWLDYIDIEAIDGKDDSKRSVTTITDFKVSPVTAYKVSPVMAYLPSDAHSFLFNFYLFSNSVLTSKEINVRGEDKDELFKNSLFFMVSHLENKN